MGESYMQLQVSLRDTNLIHTEKGWGACDDEGRHWSDVARSQVMPAANRSWTGQGTVSLLEPMEGEQIY